MSMLKTALAGGALWAGLMFSVSVSAHPKLLSSAPAAGAQGAAPGVIELRFSENLLTQFSGAKLTMTDMPGMPNSPMPVKASVAAGTDPKVMLIKPASALTAGTYRVDWRAVSSDTHPITGNVVFSVQP
ncbi:MULTISPECIES: copper homeostasis periplasmic binding protein CopC [Pseudomonas]|jgi:copper resistance protein C|uniref:Copper resistance protein C n=2 Tax=Pseudomonas TaxID=286 RepID=A0A4Y9TLY3_PSEFL|nr:MULTISPECIES: copper homeostasis periplasmic binding protein CopC [Pseudomonas]CRM98221.1 Copper resistance protein C precursor [Pseudomonas sp. 22 E 5]MCX9149737.1 copper homeostasis periplasmic binding protein CopC [Pseudomonas sp. TB1-B1]QXH66056.1 copper homeostasis periplasmic binding protein CopC [Pseudomonas asgharzadehiana]TFW45355.1 copper homeostasis periplasmic binding protein CopC [Pseudomonas fluorescens]TKJ65993.1 copper resistance protein CopC [Pseudomonas sp. CFBP13506]